MVKMGGIKYEDDVASILKSGTACIHYNLLLEIGTNVMSDFLDECFRQHI